MLGFYLAMFIGIGLSALAGLWVKRSYSKYSKVRSYSGMTGAQVARMILDRNGLTNVRVEPVAGTLTDHYDPRSKVVRLSEGNFKEPSIAAVSVAAHECGHAIQDATGYVPMKLRAGIFPVVNFSNQLFFPLLLGGFLFGGFSGQGGLGLMLIQLAAILFLAVFAFHVITLPVEINASTRAYGLLTRYGTLSHDEAGGTRRVLTAAAFTYIAAAVSSLLILLYLLLASRQ